MSIVEHRRRLADTVAEGTALRNEAISLGPDDGCGLWLARREDFDQRVRYTVGEIDKSDVPHIATMNTLDGPMGRRELGVRADSPFLADPHAALLLSWHDTQLGRIRDVIRWHSERYGAIREGEKTKSSTPVPEPEIRTWVKECVERGERMSRDNMVSAAREHFAPRKPNRGWVREARNDLIPDEWKKTGRIVLASK
jgi:hypothetical protein